MLTSTSCDSRHLETIMHLVNRTGTNKKALWPAREKTPRAGKGKETQGKEADREEGSRQRGEGMICLMWLGGPSQRLRNALPLPVQPSQVSPVPSLICGCWMSKPGSWLVYDQLHHKSQNSSCLSGLLLGCHILSFPPPPCFQVPAWRTTCSSVPLPRTLHIMPLLTARAK